MRKGFLRVAAVTPPVVIGDPVANLEAIRSLAPRLVAEEVDVALFPEMCLTGYTCGDLFHNRTLIESAAAALQALVEESEATFGRTAVIVGYPRVEADGSMYNCAAFIAGGRMTEVRKTYVPNYNEFYERRWWQPAPDDVPLTVVNYAGARLAIEICEDLWAPVPPSTHTTLAGAQVVFNLSASDDVVGKYSYLRSLVVQQASRSLCAYVYASAGEGESSTDLVFDGKGLVSECGRLLAEKQRWCAEERFVIADVDIEAIERDRLHLTTFGDCARREKGGRPVVTVDFSDLPCYDDTADYLPRFRSVNPTPFVPTGPQLRDRLHDILHIQSAGLMQRLRAVHGKVIVVGISGGLDSTLALLVAVRAFDALGLDRKGIVGVTMPGFGTTGRTHRNALDLMRHLGVTSREINIAGAVNRHFEDIGHDPSVHDVTYENSQARERTQILMDVANQTGGFVLGTGDLSELALGWATYNGDHMSMYGVNAGVPKTLVSSLVRCVADESAPEVRDSLLDILDTPISPELMPATPEGEIAQKTEDLVGPYELHDFFLYYMLRYGFSPARIRLLATLAFSEKYTPETVLHWLRTFYRRFFAQQFKRSCLPDGPKVGSVCLSPRGDWRMPSDACAALWLREVDSLR